MDIALVCLMSALAGFTRAQDAYTAAKGGVCTFRGKMLDEPVVRSARKVLARKA